MYSLNTLKELDKAYCMMPDVYGDILDVFMLHTYKTARGKEFAHHGFARRLQILVRCVQRTFEILPADQIRPPKRDQTEDAGIYLQAFIFNTFGSLDNLAWIWVSERQLKKDGKPIPERWVGLGKANKVVRESLSSEFLRHLRGNDAWFDHLEDFRHALAHRIPLYIPPCTVRADRQAEHKALVTRMNEAEASELQGSAEYRCMRTERDALETFEPVIMHSFGERARPVAFHTQVMDDFNKLVEIAWLMIGEIRSLP